jgi:hypothetical protein
MVPHLHDLPVSEHDDQVHLAYRAQTMRDEQAGSEPDGAPSDDVDR